MTKPEKFNLKRILPWLVLALILTLATLFRLYGLDEVPPAFNGDEANLSLDAISILEGNFFLVGPNEGTSGALWLYLLAGAFGLFGTSIAVARGLAVVVSLAGIAVAFIFVRYLLSSVLNYWQALSVAAVVGLYLAVARWYLEFSRIAFSANLAVLVQVSFLLVLWLALRRRTKLTIIGAGVLLGLTGFVYIPLRFTPLLILLYFLADGLLRRRRAFIFTHFKNLFSIALIGGLIYLPLIITYLTAGLGDKTRSFTFWNPVISQGDPLGTLYTSILGNLAGFLPRIVQLSGIPIAKGVDDVALILFLIGLALALWRLRQPEYLFLAVWWAFMLIPSIIAPEGAMPHLRRALGSAIPTFALIGLGVVIPAEALSRKKPAWAYAIGAIGGAIILFSLATQIKQTYQRYYLGQLTEAARLSNHIYDFKLADVMTVEGDAATAYILPVDSASGAIFPQSSTLAFLYRGRGEAEYRYIWDAEGEVFSQTQTLLPGKERIGLISWKVSKHTAANPRKLFEYVLNRAGEYESSAEYDYFNIDYYRLSETAPISAATLNPLNIPFEGGLALTGSAWANSAAVGDEIWAELSWQKLADDVGDYQVAVWLEDTAGHVVGRVDRPLLSNILHRGTSQWPVNALERDYYLFKTDPAIAPGTYHLKAVLYTLTEQGDRRLAPIALNIGSDLALPLGQLELTVPPSPPPVAELAIPRPLKDETGAELRLLGTDFPAQSQLRPGDSATASLWWQAETPLATDQTISLQLAHGEKRWPLLENQPPGGEAYPASNWPAGTIIRQFANFTLPAELESGDYSLYLKLNSAEWPLAQISISGRPRTFTAPKMNYPVNANFANQLSLLGYDLNLSDNTIDFVLHWQGQSEMNIPYKTFVHILDANGNIIAQTDREALDGTAPTTSWLPGEIISDGFSLVLPENAPQIERIIVGLYNPADGTRLSLPDGGDSVELEIELGK